MWLQHVSVPRPPGAASQAQARAFYGRLLNLPELPVPRSLAHLDLVWFQAGDAELHIFAQTEPEGQLSRHFCLAVEDVTAVRRRLDAAGHPTNDTDPIPGRPRFFCRDPFGNRIEITTITGDYRELES